MRKSSPRNKNKQSAGGHLEGAVLTHMREVAWGNSTLRETHNTLEHAIRLRDDDSLLSKAEQKRQRKANKNLQLIAQDKP